MTCRNCKKARPYVSGNIIRLHCPIVRETFELFFPGSVAATRAFDKKCEDRAAACPAFEKEV